MSPELKVRYQHLLNSQTEVQVQRAISALLQFHMANDGERFERDARGVILVDRRCYGLNRLKHLHPTARASAHMLLEEIGISVDIDLENLPPCDERR